MAKWIRLLNRPPGVSDHWHVLASDKEFAIADVLCGEKFAAPVEVARDDDRTRREGRCATCETVLVAKQNAALSR